MRKIEPRYGDGQLIREGDEAFVDGMRSWVIRVVQRGTSSARKEGLSEGGAILLNHEAGVIVVFSDDNSMELVRRGAQIPQDLIENYWNKK